MALFLHRGQGSPSQILHRLSPKATHSRALKTSSLSPGTITSQCLDRLLCDYISEEPGEKQKFPEVPVLALIVLPESKEEKRIEKQESPPIRPSAAREPRGPELFAAQSAGALGTRMTGLVLNASPPPVGERPDPSLLSVTC